MQKKCYQSKYNFSFWLNVSKKCKNNIKEYAKEFYHNQENIKLLEVYQTLLLLMQDLSKFNIYAIHFVEFLRFSKNYCYS